MATVKKAAAVKNAASVKKSPAGPALVVPPAAQSLSPAQLQIQAFERAVRHFSAQQFAEALAAFAEVTKGPAADVSQRARSYIQVCERRLAVPSLKFRSADDHYNYAVERLNARDLDKARQHLASALKLQPRGEHILYTLGICCGLAGDGTGAYENLKLAIEIDPRNRVHARQDSHFAAAAEHFPNLRSLVGA